MTIQENIARKNELVDLVATHCMCAHLSIKPDYYFIYYPLGFQLDGLRVSRGMGEIKSLEKCLEKMELHWKESQLCGLN